MTFEELKINPNNPRKVTKAKFIRLKNKIKSFPKMLRERPVVYDENGVVLGGNTKLLVLRDLVKEGFELKDEYFRSVNDYTEEEKKKFVVFDNVHEGDWDDDILANRWSDLPLNEWGINTGGWQHDVKEVDTPDLPKVPDSQPGTVYMLGRHRLMCGDATKFEDVESLMGANKADLIFTDPPYNVDYESAGGNGYRKGKYAGKKVFNDNLEDTKFIEFLTKSLINARTFSKDHANIYMWFAMKNYNQFREGLEASGFKYMQTIFWVKDRFVMALGNYYHRTYEPCMVGYIDWTKKKMAKGFAKLRDSWDLDFDEFQSRLDLWYIERDAMKEYKHPTQKPVRLAKRAIDKNTDSGDLVLDLFGGSGSTLMACEQMNRTCYTMELDPAYCDVIRERYKILTEGK